MLFFKLNIKRFKFFETFLNFLHLNNYEWGIIRNMKKGNLTMNKSLKELITTTAVFLLVFAGFITGKTFAYSPVELYDDVWKLVNKKYVDQTNNQQDWRRWRYKYEGKIKTDEDAYVAIDTMLASLNDPYTKFLDPKEFAEETASIKGSLKGIGIQISVKDGKLMVISPIEGSPAEAAGILADDEILEIDGESTKGMSIDKAAERIRGEKGTTVTLNIKRGNDIKKYSVVRDEIEIKAVSTKLPDGNTTVIPAEIQYIRISSFISKHVAQDVSNILMNSKKKKAYIIDLRSNPGGLLTNAIFISRMLLQNSIIVSTVDRDGYKQTERAGYTTLTHAPIAVLINKGSASASEILSGALKDNGRAIIIGDQSFGKGLVQEINKLPEGSGVNITIQRYLTPNGTDIHKKGITPDILVKLSEEDIKNKNDVQLKKAIEVLSQQCNLKCSK